MKRVMHILNYFAVLTIMVACSQPTKVESPEPCRSVAGPTQELAAIDTLLWHHPDSALAVMMEFAGSEAADGLDEFEGHYCQVLVAELLYKNDYGQSNREEVLKAVGYFDSIDDGFLAARAHYINGVGFYERDSVVAACGEYLKALEIVETHFPGIETRHGTSLQPNHLPRFMALTYGRLGDLFSGQFMQEPAIVCYKKSFVFSKIEATSANGIARLMISIGKQYDVLSQTDSTGYYYNEAFKYLADTNNLAYRDLISGLALYNYYSGKGVEPAVCDLNRMATQTTDEDERLTRFFTIGSIYFENSQYDSALVYLVPVFENKDNVSFKRDAARSLRDIYQIQGDSLKATYFALYLAENPVHEGESNRQVSHLNELFQQHLQWKQERAEAERQQAARRRNLWIGGMVALLAIVGLAVAIMTRRSHRKRLAAQEAKVQILNEEKQQLQTQVDDTLQQLQTQADDALQQARAMLPQRVADLYRAKVPNRLERIIDEFEVAYPQALEKLAAAYPELNETEQQIAVLNFLHFRAKEEADLLDLSKNTVNKYRSNLRKKTENASFSSFLD
jgi:DNA-binding CsgD family transcriptional regulator